MLPAENHQAAARRLRQKRWIQSKRDSFVGPRRPVGRPPKPDPVVEWSEEDAGWAAVAEAEAAALQVNRRDGVQEMA